MDYQIDIENYEPEFQSRALHLLRGRINMTELGIGLNKGTLIRRIRAHGLASAAPKGVTI